jgi:hypothetical protein
MCQSVCEPYQERVGLKMSQLGIQGYMFCSLSALIHDSKSKCHWASVCSGVLWGFTDTRAAPSEPSSFGELLVF